MGREGDMRGCKRLVLEIRGVLIHALPPNISFVSYFNPLIPGSAAYN